MSIRSFEKRQYILGNLQGHVHVRGCVHTQSCVYAKERVKKALISHLQKSLQALSKQEVKAKRDVEGACQSTENIQKHKH